MCSQEVAAFVSAQRWTSPWCSDQGGKQRNAAVLVLSHHWNLQQKAVRTVRSYIVAAKAGEIMQLISGATARLLVHIWLLTQRKMRNVSDSRGSRTNPRTGTTVCGSADILSQCECFPWLTFSWARFRDFWTRLAMKPAPAWRFGPILFSAIVTFCSRLLRSKLSPAPVRCLLKLPSSLWRLQFKAMEVEQQRKGRDTLTTDSWAFRHTVVRDWGGAV